MSTAATPHMPWVFWPFVAFWAIFMFALRAAARIACLLLGFMIMVMGVALCMTVIGAVVGLPMLALGMLLLGRALF